MKMIKAILIITFALIAFSLSRSVGAQDDKNKQTNQASKSTEDVNLDEVMAECNKSFTTEMSYIEALNKSGSFPDESDKTPKCYVRCVMENMGIMSSDGVFDPKRVVVVFAGKRNDKTMVDIQDMAIMCSERKETCKCEKAYNFMKCLMSSEIEKYEKKI